MIVLVVELDYLPDSEVFVFQPCLYPMKTLHPRSMYTLPRGGVQRGVPPLRGPGGLCPRLGGLGGKRALGGGGWGFRGSVPQWGFEVEAPEGKISL
jgi:hypothetical protein